MTLPIFIDFETFWIEDRPNYPPGPVGLGILWPGGKPKYYAFGHPYNNNCTSAEAREELRTAYNSGRPIVAHNAVFDCEVAEAAWDLKTPWERVHDTQLSAFLEWPLELKLGLKYLAEKYLNMPPEDRNRLHDWIQAHVPEAKRLRAERRFAKFYSVAPGNLVGRYCCADLRMTKKLWNRTKHHVGTEPYERERKLLPLILSMEKRGVPLDELKLRADVVEMAEDLEAAEAWIRKKLGNKDIDLSKQAEVVYAIEHADLIDEWIETSEGKPSLSYQNLSVLQQEGKFHSPQFVNVWKYRTLLRYCIRTFVQPWLTMANGTGTIHCRWNSVRMDRGGGGFGARTGRWSSTPNFQNIIKRPDPIPLPAALRDCGPIPSLRSYIKAPRGFKLVGADFSQQEMRILAHFVGGDFKQAYLDNPDLDSHATVAELIRRHTGLVLPRGDVKTTGFRILYGSGIQGLAEALEKSYSVAKTTRLAYKKSLPGIGKLERMFTLMRIREEKYQTIGGREYEVERGFEYKGLNYLIQGSAADEMKEAMLRFDEVCPDKLILSVHDEPVALVPTKDAKRTESKLVDAMVSTGLDGGERSMLTVPMRADGYIRTRWSG